MNKELLNRMFAFDTDNGGNGGGQPQDAPKDPPSTDTDAPPGKDGGEGNGQPPKVFSQSDVDRIIKERLDRQAKQHEDAQKKAQADAERKAAEEQGKFKELYEKAQLEIVEAQKQAEAERLARLRQSVAAEKGLPAKIAERLQGSTVEEMQADADALLEAMPKPQPPNINAGGGDGGKPQPGTYTEAEKQELAAVYGVNAKYWQ